MTKKLQNFIARNASGTFSKPSDDFFHNYASIFPQEIIEIFNQLGFGFCEHKCLQIVDSSSFIVILYEFGISILDSAVFAITALGDLLIYQKESFENQAPGLFLYSLRDMTCTRLCHPQALSEWFGELDFSDIDNLDKLPDNRKNALIRAIHTLGLGSYVYGPRDFSAYALEPGMMLGEVVYEGQECERLEPVHAISYLQDFCESITLRNDDNAIPFKQLTLDEKIASETAKAERFNTPEDAVTDDAAAATHDQIIAPSESHTESEVTAPAAQEVQPTSTEAYETAQDIHEDQPTDAIPETPVIAPLYAQPQQPAQPQETPVIAPLYAQPQQPVQPQETPVIAPLYAQPQQPAQPTPAQPVYTHPQAQNLTYGSLQSLVDLMLQRLRPLRFEQTVQFEPYQHGIDILENKLGGAFYIPANKQAPKNLQTGVELALLAQLNFANMPKIKDFPEDGLLQFFIDPDPVQFRNSYHPTNQISWRIRYIPHSPSHSELPFLNGYMPPINSVTSVTTLPFTPGAVLSLAAHDMPQLTAWEDFPFKAMLSRHCADLMPQNPTPEQVGLLRAARDMVRSALEPECKSGHMKDEFIQIGGYPTFKHTDPRAEDPRFPGVRTPAVLLLQIPSIDRHQIRWGNSDVVHFFISRKDLREKDFSRVMFDI